MSVIEGHYTVNEAEIYAFPCFKRIVELFQYPNVCQMVDWWKDAGRKEKCAELIRALVEKPL